ncbi:MAG: helix-turn-helix domain-containing protein [Candidatus Pacebacteria bacterium]|nr:helix-turn-helix domain-containing protein [Candidatus Paceibacterota bacterium]
MKTVGELLHDGRVSLKKDVHEIARTTHIREEYLEAMEQNAFEKLPEGPFVKGFLRTYALELNMEPDHVLAVYRRDFGDKKIPQLFPKGLVYPIRRLSYLTIHPFVFGIGVVCCVVGFFLAYQWYVFTQPPEVIVYEPTEKQETHSPLQVRGKTSTDAVVYVNANPVALDQDGKFTTNIELQVGEQTVRVEVQSRQGKRRVIQRVVRVLEK